MDAAKLASILVTDEYGVKELLDNPGMAKKCVPIVLIPTTAGTGAEVTPNAIVGVPEKELKIGIVNENMIADYVILDARLIKNLPRKIAAATGVDALASQKELYDHYVEVAKHVNIPIVLYNIPMRTGNKLLPETVEKLARDVDVIMGAKDSSGDRENLKAYIDRTRDLEKPFSVLAGNDGNILYCLENGGTGGIAGRANIWPATVASIYDHFVAGDLDKAREAQEAVAKIQPVFKFGNPNTIIKKAVSLMGYPVGDCRRPFSYLCDEGLEALKQVLEATKDLG